MLTKKELKKKSKEYRQGYEDGADAFDCGHPEDPNEMVDDFGNPVSDDYYQGYWDGFEDAQAEYNYETCGEY